MAKANVDPAVARLRALAKNGGQPTAMASPPTITLGAVSGATAIPSAVSTYNWTSASLTKTAGEWVQYGTVFPDTLAGRGKTTTAIVGDLSPSGSTGYAPAIEFTFTGRYIEPYVLNKAFDWRLYVDGQYVELPNIPPAGGGRRCLIDFGATVSGKHIRIENTGGSSMGIIDVLTESTATVIAVTAYPDRLVIFGDSVTAGTGATLFKDSAAYKIAKELGFGDHRVSGLGGTGWLQISGSSINGDTRFPIDVTAITPTVAILWMGGNDMGDGNDAAIQTLVGTKIEELRAASPMCLIHVFAPYDAGAPGVPVAGFTGIQTALQNASSSKARTWFHSLEGISYTKSDIVHPDDAGYNTLYKAIYNKIAAAHGLHTVA